MTDFPCCKLEIFIPESHLSVLQQALWETDAGHIGKYDCCLSYSPVTGCWRPLGGIAPLSWHSGAAPYRARAEGGSRLSHRGGVEAVLAAVKRVHPYEEPVINVIPLYRTGL